MNRLQRMSVGRPLYFENFERRICPAAVSFTEHVLAEDSIAGAIRSLIAADVDADGLTDIVAAGNDTYWYPNGGSDNFDHEIWISGYGGGLQVGDMDLDGDLDIFLGMTWHENVDGQGGNFQPAFEIRRGGAGTLADLDNDGDLDLVAWRVEGRYSWGSVFWHENIDRLQVGVFGPAIHLWSGWDLTGGSLHAADLNLDGRNDIIFNHRGELGTCGGLGWFPGQDLVHEPFGAIQWADGWPDHGEQHACSGIPPAIFDVDGDGDPDIVGRHKYESGLFLYENDGKGRFARQHIPVELPGMPEKVLPADIDNDGDIDLVFSSSTPLGNGQVRNHGTFWLENMDGAGTFETVHDLAEVVELQDVADLDGDGDLDVIASRGSRILWYESDSAEDPDGDVDGNGVVNFADFLIISANFGRTDATPEEGDLNYDGTVNFADFLLLSRDFGMDFRPEVVFHLDFDGQIRDGSNQTLPLAVGPSVTPDAPGPILESGTQLSAGLWAGTNDDNNQILVFDHPILDEVSQSAGAIVTWVNVDDQTEWNNIAKTICPQHEEPCSAFGRDRGIELQATNTSGVFGGIQGYSTDTFGPAHGSNGGPGGTETPSGEWVHVALAWDDQGQRTVYVNGMPGDTKADLADGVFGLNEPGDWIIGGDALPVDGDPNGRRLSGRLADFAILSGELGEETLRAIIQGGIQNTGLPGLPPNQEPHELAPVFHLDFERLADASANKLPLLAGDAVKLAPGEGPTLENGRILDAGRWEDETRDTNQLLVLDNPILDGVSVSAGSIVTWINPDDGDGFNNILKTVCPGNVEPCAAFGPDAGFELHASGPHAGVYGAVQGFLGNGNVFGPLAPEPFGPNPKVTDTPGGVWTHVALTWNELGDRTIYLNGVAGHRQVGFGDGIEFGLNDPGDWTIGGDASASTPFNSDETRRFEGKLSDFAIFDVELTDAQIETILREGVSRNM